MILLAETARRAEQHTPQSINRKIHEHMQQRIDALAGNRAAMHARLQELDREWDIERCLETGSATLTLTGLLLGATVNKRWLLLSAVVQTFFMQHALQGWCPPLPIFRALGVRTQREIEAERHAIKALLGEYDQAGDQVGAYRAASGSKVLRAAMSSFAPPAAVGRTVSCQGEHI